MCVWELEGCLRENDGLKLIMDLVVCEEKVEPRSVEASSSTADTSDREAIL